MRKIIIAILFIFSISSAYAKTVNITFVWNRNTEPDLAGYILYESDISGDYSGAHNNIIMGNPNIYTLQIEMNHGIPLYFVLTAFDTSGNESNYSNQVFHVIYIDTLVPTAPQILNIKNYIIIN